MRTKQVLNDLKEALKQDYLYTTKELEFMREHRPQYADAPRDESGRTGCQRLNDF